MKNFLEIASQNTRRDKETCGYLAGKSVSIVLGQGNLNYRARLVIRKLEYAIYSIFLQSLLHRLTQINARISKLSFVFILFSFRCIPSNSILFLCLSISIIFFQL